MGYASLDRPGKGAVREHLAKTTGFSRAQVTRLIAQHRETGRIEDRRGGNSGRPFARVYTPADIRPLAEADEIGGQLCGPAACEVLRREFEVFGDRRHERLSRLSASHLYNLRRTRTHRARRTTVNRTRPTAVGIGERRRPDPGGRPGFVRVDTVHQGDRGREKGVYDINLIDEVTQFEHVGAATAISEAFLLPVLEQTLATLPFVVLGFHADNGSEYINHRVAALLNKLHVPGFTKSRARRSNDNALVEGKNASVVRKWLGHDHIPQRFVPLVNAFAQGVLSPCLNHHHPCLFATEVRDAKGKVRRRYRRQDVATPYEKLKSLPGKALSGGLVPRSGSLAQDRPEQLRCRHRNTSIPARPSAQAPASFRLNGRDGRNSGVGRGRNTARAFGCDGFRGVRTRCIIPSLPTVAGPRLRAVAVQSHAVLPGPRRTPAHRVAPSSPRRCGPSR